MPNGQPFATIVTKDYPGEPSSDLGAGEFRVNVDAGRSHQADCDDPTVRDQVLPHPEYARHGWVCIVQPGHRTADEMRTLLLDAHSAAKRRWTKRHN